MKEQKTSKKKTVLKAFIILAGFLAFMCLAVFGIDAYVRNSTKHQILEANMCSEERADCILILGALVRPDGTPSKILQDRLDRGIELYKNNLAPKIVMSGDHGRVDYDEVNEMKRYAIEAGVPSEDIFMDHAGFSTYESMYRVKEVFGAQKVIVVTQRYHLYRAIYDAKSLSLETIGVPATDIHYGGQKYRDLREIAARDKDFIYTLLKVKPTYLGDQISLQGDGNVTNDK